MMHGLEIASPRHARATKAAWPVLAAMLALYASGGLARPVSAADGTWIQLSGGNGSGDWNTAANWSAGSIADGVGATADFSTLNITADSTITLDGSHTIGTLKFGDATTASNNWLLSTNNGSGLTLSVSTGTPTIQVVNQSATVGVALGGTQGLQKTGAGMLVLTVSNTYTGGTTISAGVLRVENTAALGTGAANTVPVTVTNSGTRLEVNGVTLDNGLRVAMQNGTELRGIGIAGIQGRIGPAAGATVTFSTSAASDVFTFGNNSNDFGGDVGDSNSTAVVAGPGKFVLEGASTSYTGKWIINGGTLQVESNTNGLGLASTTTVTVNAGGTLLAGTSVTIANAITVNGGTIGSAINTLTGFSGTISLTTGSTSTVTQATGNMTISGAIVGDANLIKTGNSTLHLTADNSLTGSVTVQQGTLQLSGSGALNSASSYVVNGGTISLVSGSAARLSDSASITLRGGRLILGASGETVGTVSLQSGQGIIQSTGTVTLAGLTRPDLDSTMHFNAASLGTTNKVFINSGYTDGQFMGGWSLVSSALGNGDFARYTTANGVVAVGSTTTFGAGGIGASSDIVVTADITVGSSMTINSLRLAKATSGTMTLNLAGNTVTIGSGGLMGMNPGTAFINGSGASSSSASITAGSDSNYTLFMSNLSSGSSSALSINANIINNGANDVKVVVGGGGSIGVVLRNLVNPSVGNTYAGGTYVNSGLLSVAGFKPLGTGDVYVRGGTLQLRSSSLLTLGDIDIHLGDSVGGSSVTLALGDSGSPMTVANDIIVEPGSLGTIGIRTNIASTLSGQITLNNHLSIIDDTTALTISGAIITNNGGSYGITKAVSGFLTLSNSNNSYSGATQINSGSLRLAAAGVLPSTSALVLGTSATVVVDLTNNGAGNFDQTVASLSGGGPLGGNITLGSAVLTAGGDNTSTTFAGTLTGAGGLVKQGAGTMILSNTSNNFNSLTLSGGILSISHSGNIGGSGGVMNFNGGTLRWTGNDGTLASGRTGSFSSAATIVDVATATATLTLAASFGGNGGLNKIGAGRLELSGATNTYNGTTTISAGTLHITGTLTSGGGVVAVGTTGTLQGTGLTSILRDVTVTGNGTLSFSGGAIGGTLTATGGNWTGNGSVGGTITIDPGAFTISGGSTLTASGLTTINSSGVLNLNGTLSGSASLASGGAITGSGGTITGTLTITGGAWSGSGTVNGVVSQTAGTFNLTGSGTLTTGSTVSISAGTFNVLTGSTLNNTGITTVTGSGTLSANGVISGGVIVNNGGTLHGNGTISGSVIINSGGNLSAGNSVGLLTVDDDMTWNSGSNQVFEISDANMAGTPGTDWDLITVNGELTINATPSSKVNLTIDSWPPGDALENFDVLDSYSWLWITATGGIDVSGQPVNDLFNITLGPEFAGDFPLVDVDNFNVSLSLDGLNMFVNYTVNVVPEPGTLLLASLAAAGLGVYRRRTRAKATGGDSSPAV